MKKPRPNRPSKPGPAPKGQRQPAAAAIPAQNAISPGRQWLFRLALLIIVPAVLFGALEGALRLCGYGYDTGFFKSRTIDGQKFLIENDQFGYRFFPPDLARLPVPLRMPAVKPPGATRIFILGESAAMGDPEPAFGAGRYLEALLRERFPNRQFEVINVAMTAINSHVILPIARDCARQHGDVWIVYMGNNEMVGPFGAATVFGTQAPPLGLVRLTLALEQTRVGQLLAALSRNLRPGASTHTWGGMEMFAGNRVAPHAPRRERVYRNFQRNLSDILEAGLDSGAKIILNTVAVNLKDCPPFASAPATTLSPQDHVAFETLASQANALSANGEFARAAETYGRAAQINPESAAVQFDWANCLLRATNALAAREHYHSACDLDALPFRTDDRINQIIAQSAKEHPPGALRLCDTASLLSTNNPAGVCGQESFYEHVHLNFDGNYRLARIWAEQLERLWPEWTNRSTAGVPDQSWASQVTCERRLALTDWNRYNVLAEVQRRFEQPPLSAQPNNRDRLAALTADLAGLQQRLTPQAAESARALYLDAVQRWPDDYRLKENFADFLQAIHEYPAAAAQWRQVGALIPQDHLSDFELGRLAALQDNFSEAQAHLTQALAIRPNFSEAWLELGKVHAAQTNYDLALSAYRQGMKFRPDDYRLKYFSGLALSKLHRPAEAISDYRDAVRLNPGFWKAHFELGGQLGLAGQFTEAKAELEQAVRLNPGFAPSHLNLGVALMKLGRTAAAESEFRETLRLEPGNRTALQALGQLQRSESSR
ncbi:MAG TPA: tetratricopeptide repeat protein [Verrucomicrobiae bacterium]|nr:tetratricopeptide repeat protein [Verrucomicrobiae bacterium]